LPLSETLSWIGGFLFTAALAFGPVALVSAVNAVHYVFIFLWALILSIWFPRILKEEISRTSVLLKAFSIVLIVVGVVVISIYS